MKKILYIALIMSLLLTGCASNAEQYEPRWVISNNWQSRIAIFPFTIWGEVGNGKGYNWYPACMVYPFQRYTVYPSMQGRGNMEMVQKGEGCWGYADVY